MAKSKIKRGDMVEYTQPASEGEVQGQRTHPAVVTSARTATRVNLTVFYHGGAVVAAMGVDSKRSLGKGAADAGFWE